MGTLISGGLIDICVFSVFRGSPELHGEWAADASAVYRSDTSPWHQENIWSRSDLAHVSPAPSSLQVQS